MPRTGETRSEPDSGHHLAGQAGPNTPPCAPEATLLPLGNYLTGSLFAAIKKPLHHDATQ